MDSVISRCLSAALIIASLIISQPAAAQRLCGVNSRADLTMDERDGLRIQCLKRHAPRLNVRTCLKIANTMEYATNADEARQVCLTDLSRVPTGSECLQITRSMEFPDNGDEARWTCLLRPERKVSRKICLALAKEMQYPANQQRAHLFCSQEVSP